MDIRLYLILTCIFTCLVQRSGCTGDPCPLFETTATHNVDIEGACYYAFDEHVNFDDALSLCESERTHLVHLETEDKQIAIWKEIGSSYGQHWMGLQFVDDSWVWWDNGSYTPVTSSRWEGGDSGECANTNTNENTGNWKVAQKTNSFPTVCEDGLSAVPEPTEAPIEETTPAATTPAATTPAATTPAATTPAATTPASTTTSPVLSAGVMQAVFEMTSSVSKAVLLDSSPSVYNLDCARLCSQKLDCLFYQFVSNSCKMYANQEDGIDVPCQEYLTCFQRILYP